MPGGSSYPNDERLLLCTPTGRDAALTEAALADTGLRVESCQTIDEAQRTIAANGGIAILTFTSQHNVSTNANNYTGTATFDPFGNVTMLP